MSLERRKIYVSIEDEEAQTHNLIRVIDESGEDYLFPERCLSQSSYLNWFGARY